MHHCDGGTGLTGRDVTPEALAQLGGKDIRAFGELFRWLSFAKIGTSTIQSRACAVVARGTYVFALPGSTGAVMDGWDDILVHQLDSRFRPCNFVELMPRLREVETLTLAKLRKTVRPVALAKQLLHGFAHDRASGRNPHSRDHWYRADQ